MDGNFLLDHPNVVRDKLYVGMPAKSLPAMFDEEWK